MKLDSLAKDFHALKSTVGMRFVLFPLPYLNCMSTGGAGFAVIGECMVHGTYMVMGG